MYILQKFILLSFLLSIGSSKRALLLVKDRGTVTQRFGTLLSEVLLTFEGSNSLLLPHWARIASFKATLRWNVSFLRTIFTTVAFIPCCQIQTRWRANRVLVVGAGWFSPWGRSWVFLSWPQHLFWGFGLLSPAASSRKGHPHFQRVRLPDPLCLCHHRHPSRRLWRFAFHRALLSAATSAHFRH